MKRQIPTKNYVILMLLSLFTILLVFGLVNLYNKNNHKEQTAMTFLLKIKENELRNYITENRDTIIYMASSNKEKTKEVETNLKDYILNNDLSNDIVYLDLSEVSEHFYTDFSNNYLNQSSKLDLLKEPVIVIIDDGKVTDYLNNLETEEQLKAFLKSNEEIE